MIEKEEELCPDCQQPANRYNEDCRATHGSLLSDPNWRAAKRADEERAQEEIIRAFHNDPQIKIVLRSTP